MGDGKGMNGHRFERLLHGGPPEVPSAQRPRPEDLRFPLEQALGAVYGLHASIPGDAFTARTLGTEREGNAVLIGEDGLFLTIGYLVTEADMVDLTDANGRQVRGRAIGFDQETGFGLIRALDPVEAPPLAFGDSTTLATGRPVIVAASGGPRQAMSALVVSRRAFAGYWEYLLDRAIFSAPPHGRWSGAAMIGLDGRLLGVGSLLVPDAEDGARPVAGNMFVPIDLLPPILESLAATGRSGRPVRPWLGMLTAEADDRLAVAGVTAGGPAHGAGLREGDILLSVQGQNVDDLAQFYRVVWSAGPPGSQIVI
ncbi:MAG: S1C family serine protease, partial [Alphaproteobacteria bacterium]